MSEPSTELVAARSPQAVLMYAGSQIGQAASSAVLKTILARYLHMQRTIGFNVSDLRTVCDKLIRPAVMALIRREEDVLAQFARLAAVQVEIVKSRNEANRMAAIRSQGVAKGPLPSLADHFSGEGSFGNETQRIIEEACRKAKGGEAETQNQGREEQA